MRDVSCGHMSGHGSASLDQQDIRHVTGDLMVVDAFRNRMEVAMTARLPFTAITSQSLKRATVLGEECWVTAASCAASAILSFVFSLTVIIGGKADRAASRRPET